MYDDHILKSPFSLSNKLRIASKVNMRLASWFFLFNVYLTNSYMSFFEIAVSEIILSNAEARLELLSIEPCRLLFLKHNHSIPAPSMRLHVLLVLGREHQSPFLLLGKNRNVDNRPGAQEQTLTLYPILLIDLDPR